MKSIINKWLQAQIIDLWVSLLSLIQSKEWAIPMRAVPAKTKITNPKVTKFRIKTDK